MKNVLAAAVLCLVAGTASVAQQPAPATVDSDTFAGLQARSIGPAVMSGRITAIDAVPGDRLTI